MLFTINTFVSGISNPYANCFNRVAIRLTIIFLKTFSRLFFARTQYALARYGLPFCRFGLMKDKTIQIIHLLPQLKPSPQAILFALLSNSFLFSGLAEIYYLHYIYRFYLFLYMNLYTGQEKIIPSRLYKLYVLYFNILTFTPPPFTPAVYSKYPGSAPPFAFFLTEPPKVDIDIQNSPDSLTTKGRRAFDAGIFFSKFPGFLSLPPSWSLVVKNIFSGYNPCPE